MSQSLHSCQWGPCQLQFDSLDNLFRHVSNDHIGRKSTQNLCLQCQWNGCGTMAAKRDHLASHLRVHLPLKPYVCSTCDKSFKRPQDLKKHERIHTPEHQASLLSNQPGYKPVRRKRNATAENSGANYNDTIPTSLSSTIASTSMTSESTMKDHLSELSVSDLSFTYKSPVNSTSQPNQQSPFSTGAHEEEEDTLMTDLIQVQPYNTQSQSHTQSELFKLSQPQEHDPLQAFIDDILYNQAMPSYDQGMMDRLNALGPYLQQPISCQPEHALTLQHWLEQLSSNIDSNNSPSACSSSNYPATISAHPTTATTTTDTTISPEILLQQDYDLYPKLDVHSATVNAPPALGSNNMDFLSAAFTNNDHNLSVSPVSSTSFNNQQQQQPSWSSDQTSISSVFPGYIYSTPLLYHSQLFDNNSLMSSNSTSISPPFQQSQPNNYYDLPVQSIDIQQQQLPPPLPPRRNNKQTMEKPPPRLPPRKQPLQQKHQQQQQQEEEAAAPPLQYPISSAPSPVVFETAKIPSKGMTPVIDYSTAITFEEKKEIMHLMNVFSSSKTDLVYKREGKKKEGNKGNGTDEAFSQTITTMNPSTVNNNTSTSLTSPFSEGYSSDIRPKEDDTDVVNGTNSDLYPILKEQQQEKDNDGKDTSPYADLVSLVQNMSLSAVVEATQQPKKEHMKDKHTIPSTSRNQSQVKQQHHSYIVKQLIERIPTKQK